ncbi:hypothetical protein [Angustibacter luteus]|uniref:Uncharacterized protein n=1 Tax=Angustibacter luteus TaxID=658456 RepID=A0ABW1JDA9_9ACTN
MAQHTEYSVTAVVASNLDLADPGAVHRVLDELADHSPQVLAEGGQHEPGHVLVAVAVLASSLAEAVRQAIELFEPLGAVVEIRAMATSRHDVLYAPAEAAEPHTWHCTCRHCLAASLRHPISSRTHQSD